MTYLLCVGHARVCHGMPCAGGNKAQPVYYCTHVFGGNLLGNSTEVFFSQSLKKLRHRSRALDVQAGHWKKAVSILASMQTDGVEPNVISYSATFAA